MEDFRNYSKKAKLIEANLTNILCDHQMIISKKLGMGLFRGVKVKSFNKLSSIEVAKSIYDISLSKGLLLRRVDDILIIKPPLVITDNEIYEGFNRLSSSFSEFINSSM